jgi:hypothetical protein
VSDGTGDGDGPIEGERTDDWQWDGESWQLRDADQERSLPPGGAATAPDHGWFWDGAQWQPAS